MSRQPVIEQLPIQGAYVLTFQRPRDKRGYFNEVYNEKTYPSVIRGSVEGDWKQVALSMTEQANTLRGLHASPYNKFCSILSGGISDVIVDVREDSPTFLKWCALELSEENRKQVHIPAFCLHGFISVLPNTRMLYLQGGTYSDSQESDINAFDVLLDIKWPLRGDPLMSDKDRNAPRISDVARKPHLAGRLAMPRALIVGASGQVGFALLRELRSQGYLVYGTHSSHAFPDECTVPFDLDSAAKDPSLAEALIDLMHPKVVVICAAFTAVDQAEDSQERVHTSNVIGPGAVATASKRIGAKLVVYSTDYVWDGTRGPYGEADPPCAVNVYGKSKADMESHVLEIDPSVLVLRTTVVYGPERQGKNFIYQLFKKLMAKDVVHVVTDQISTPTYNRDLAVLTRLLLEAGASGIFNACGEELLSRHDFAIQAAESLGLDASRIQPCFTSDMKQRACRPLKAGMRMDKAISLLGGKFRPRTVREAMADWISNPGEGTVLLGVSPESRL